MARQKCTFKWQDRSVHKWQDKSVRINGKIKNV